MSTPIDSHAEEALTELAERFEHWRQSRTHGRARIPEDLWDQAIALSTVLSNARVAKRLRLMITMSGNQKTAPRHDLWLQNKSAALAVVLAQIAQLLYMDTI